MPHKIIVIDDEESMCSFMAIMLHKEGYDVVTCTDSSLAVEKIKDGCFDLVISDMMMPGLSGIELLTEVKKDNPNQPFIVMTAFASVESAIDAMRKGASDYLTKPFKVDEIKITIEKVISHHQVVIENRSLKKKLALSEDLDSFIGVSGEVTKLKDMIRQIARADSTVLLKGESGTGKDLLARAIHALSTRGSGPMISINCAAIPETLLESELFGHGKGAFTGAIKAKDGLFKVAQGGTFFLDEIGNTSLAIQVKLLRVLEERRITPIGETVPIPIDVRLICATNADLESEVKSGRFRADLFYRLNVIPISIPPLRDRIDDIPLLVDHFVEQFCSKHGVTKKEVATGLYEMLATYAWPGNVRELENSIERAVLFCTENQLTPESFPENIRSGKQESIVGTADPKTPTLESIESAYIQWVLQQSDGNKSKTARKLGIDTSTLYRKLDRIRKKGFEIKE